jgi:hypothetical protein
MPGSCTTHARESRAGAASARGPGFQRSFDSELPLLRCEAEDDEEEDDESRPDSRLLLLDPASRLPPLSRLRDASLRDLSDCDFDLFDWLAMDFSFG